MGSTSPAPPPPLLPADSDGPNTVASTGSVTVTLTPDRTRALLQQVPAAYRTQINDVLLTALSQVLTRWTGQDQILIDLEGHGREEDQLPGTDLSRTVGWFTTIYPVALTATPPGGWGQALKTVKEQLRAIPRHGLGYGALRYLSPHPELATPARGQLQLPRPARPRPPRPAASSTPSTTAWTPPTAPPPPAPTSSTSSPASRTTASSSPGPTPPACTTTPPSPPSPRT